MNSSLAKLLKKVDFNIALGGLTWTASTGCYYAFYPLPSGVTSTNYWFSVIYNFSHSGGYCEYVGYENGQLMIKASQKPDSNGLISITVVYNG